MRRLQQMQVNSGTRTIINNAYNYDLVGNVLGIKNTAPVVNNTLGGSAEQNYQYDELYRLKTATGSYTGEFTQANYQLNMSYNNLHNITKKELIHTVNGQQKGYTLHYDYGNTEHPNAPNAITEVGKPEPRKYSYDGNGNPTNYSELNSFRKMTWDEENRLMGINDNGKLHIYSYDANGERVIKSNGDSQNVTINGTNAATLNHFENYTAYVSPYFVVNKGKFTKHYFEGAGRVTSKIGEGTFKQPAKITAGGYNYGQLSALQQQAIDAYIASLGIPPGPITQQGIYASPQLTGQPYPSAPTQNANENQEPPQGWPRQPVFNAPNDVPGPPVQFGPPITPTDVKAGEGFVGNGLPEKDVFYYHPDHLGSTNYVTGITGQITEHIETMAFGEILFEEHSSSFTTPYIFTGLELDRETNLTYASQRYLDMKTSIFVGVDKLAEKYPNFSGYIYAMQNPIRLTDPTGMEPVDERKIDITIPISSGYESNLQKLLNINKIGTAGINPGGDGGDSELNHAMHAGGDYDQEDPPTKAQPKPGEFVSPQMEMNYKINEFALDAVMWVDGAAELSALKWGLAKASVKGWFSFGAKNAMAEGKLANHLFKGTGKLADTAGNRALITKISNGKSLGVDAYGKSWYAKTLGNGTQIYSYTQNGIIKGAGLNQTPVNIIARYGLK